MSKYVELYNSTYGSFSTPVLREIRRLTYGEDVGQNSWLTADELRHFIVQMGVARDSHVLEVACGSGGPAVFLALTAGCRITGVDINELGIRTGNALAAERDIADRVRFQQVDAGRPLPFPDGAFEALICIDAVNHLPDRSGVFREWHRVVKPGGRILFTDPCVVTGILSNEELATRSSIGYFLFVPRGENERLLTGAGFTRVSSWDGTENTADVSERWYDARASHRSELSGIEDEQTYEGFQKFLEVVHRLSSQKRLSRIVFLALRK